MGYTLQDVEDAEAALLLDHPQTLTVGPVAVENNILAREATQLSSSLPRMPRARRHRRCSGHKPGDKAIFGIPTKLGRALNRGEGDESRPATKGRETTMD
jgi:hypothetical protein